MNTFATSVRGFRKCVFFYFYRVIMHFFKNTLELELKIIKFSFEGAYFHRSSMKLTQVMPVNIIQSWLWDFHTFHRISSIYHLIVIYFFGKYVRIKIKDHKILVRMSKISPKLDEVNASWACKLNSILWYFYVFHQFTT